MVDECENCGEALKIGMLSSNQSFSAPLLRIINLASNQELAAACNKCGDTPLAEAKKSLAAETARLKREVTAVLPQVPLVSIHSPFKWEYDVVGIVTAQSVTGTGIFSDVASAFTDLFGTQSGTYNSKLRDGENICVASMRAQAIEAGANAIIAADIDYAEVGGQRAMLMVCMTGTAIKLTNPDRVALTLGESAAQATEKARRIRAIDTALTASAGY